MPYFSVSGIATRGGAERALRRRFAGDPGRGLRLLSAGTTGRPPGHLQGIPILQVSTEH